MRPTLGRRLPAGAAAVAAACALATLAGDAAAAPARVAQDQAAAAPELDIRLDDMTVTHREDGYLVAPVVTASEKVSVTNARYTYELSGLTQVILGDDFSPTRGAPEQPCTVVSPTRMTCGQEYMWVGGGSSNDFMQAHIWAVDAPFGQTGTLTVTFEGDNVRPVTRSVRVKTATGAVLATGSPGETVRARPGTHWSQVFEVTNVSGAVLHGATVTIGTQHAIAATKQFTNCFYLDDAPRACTFDQDLEPGVRYRIRLPFRVRDDAFTPARFELGIGWLTADKWAEYRHSGLNDDPGEAGSGEELTLSPVAAPGEPIDADTALDTETVAVRVPGKRGADLAAIGDRVSGPAGSTVTVRVGMRNNGPATIAASLNGLPEAYVSIPRGISVVAVPKGCGPGNPYLAKPGTVLYACHTGELFPVRTTVLWPFRLMVGASTAIGGIETSPRCDLDPYCTAHFGTDTDRSNDLAKIVIAEEP